MAYPNYGANFGSYGFQQPSYYQQSPPVPDMLNQFKSPYQQQIPVQQQPNPVAPSPAPIPQNDIIWVQGEAGAKAYLVAPNNTITLWDSENQTIYLKSADSSGVPSMRVLDWTERSTSTPKPSAVHECSCSWKFVSLDDFNAVKERLDALYGEVQALSSKSKKITKAKEETDDG